MAEEKSNIKVIREKLYALKDESHAEVLQRFFKTGPGQYGQGDRFIGVRVPQLRALARVCKDLIVEDIPDFLSSPIHEERLLALIILVGIYQKANDEILRQKVFNFYVDNTRHINNWDLVDLSAEHIVGAYLFDREKIMLKKLAVSDSLWERRISVMATFYFIKQGEFQDALSVIGILLSDKEDLIHKACGWMLREIGKRDIHTEEKFLRANYKSIPRTMLRYAIERFPENKRQDYLKGT